MDRKSLISACGIKKKVQRGRVMPALLAFAKDLHFSVGHLELINEFAWHQPVEKEDVDEVDLLEVAGAS
jgi:hypothetical protein